MGARDIASPLRRIGIASPTDLAMAEDEILKISVGLARRPELEALLRRIRERFAARGRNLLKEPALKRISYISTGVRSLDDLLEGGVETRAITEFIGEFGAGKTQLCHQLAVMVQLPVEEGGLGARALYIDAEGTFRPERIVQMARSRGRDPEEALENIVYARAYKSSTFIELARAGRALAGSLNIGLVIADGPLALPRAEYPGREKLYLRRFASWRIMMELLRLAEHGLAVVMTNQVVEVPEKGLRPASNLLAGLCSTHRLWFYKMPRGVRRAVVYASLRLPLREAYFRISEEGLVEE